MKDCILEMKGISKRFPGTVALDGVDFCLRKGRIHALIGENGAGKSTLMNVLIGIHSKDQGEILLNGKIVENNHPYEASKEGISMVPQELNLIPDVSIAENVFLGNEKIKNKLGWVDWKETEEEARNLLLKLGVDTDVKQKLSNLSAAYQQLVSIARSLAAGSEILIMDEPTASLTLTETATLFKSMKKLKEEGKSIVFISHHLEEIKEITDDITVMRDSKVVYDGKTADLSIEEMIFYMANRKVEYTKNEIKPVSDKVFMEIRNFSRKDEFNDISFTIHEGEILGVAGLVGAGRTELFQSIYGITKKETGEIFLQQNKIEINNVNDAIKLGIGLVPEERRVMGIFPLLSVAENMMIPSFNNLSKAGWINSSKVNSKASQHSNELKIKTPSMHTLIKNLSGGNQQKVILARWIAKGIKLLILDEPTRGIDVGAKSEIHKLIRQMASEGVTVVVISSEMDEVIAISDRIMIMHEGNLKGLIKNADCTHEDILKIALK